jgi:hypothetical protein
VQTINWDSMLTLCYRCGWVPTAASAVEKYRRKSKKYVRPAVLNAGYKVLDPEHSNDYIKGFLEYLDDQYNPGEGPTEDGLIFIPFEKPKRSRSKAKKRAESSDLEDSGKSNIF